MKNPIFRGIGTALVTPMTEAGQMDYAALERLVDHQLKGGIDALIDWDGKSEEITLMRYMEDKRTKEDKVYDDPMLMRTPVVRNGKQATVGYCPEIWATWE